ncbi:MAG TPA: PEP-CTERM sorting domain-containing protein [Armatimonadota bacterium]|nr:PEP-CTERM sorting domain-containing protein [Armatimonadota bacterium]
MKFLRFAVIAVFLSLTIQCMAVAQQIPPPDWVKYSQLPNETWPSYDLSSEIKPGPALAAPINQPGPIYESVMADDWVCPDGLPISDIHWWGSFWLPFPGEPYGDYSNARPNAAPGGIEGFNLKIYSDMPANDPKNPFGFSFPDAVLWDCSIQGQANETWAFDLKDNGGLLKESVYKYDTFLPEEKWFAQEKGKIYWLSVQAILPDPTKQWGWHETTGIQNDIGVMMKGGSEFWFIPCGGHDMAFDLTVVPEPSSILALLTGFTGLVSLRLRRRK